jgi:hypothetical protein
MALIYPGRYDCRVCQDNIPDDGGYSTAGGITMNDGVDFAPLCDRCSDALQGAREYVDGENRGVEPADIAHLCAALLRAELMESTRHDHR